MLLSIVRFGNLNKIIGTANISSIHLKIHWVLGSEDTHKFSNTFPCYCQASRL